MIKLKSTYIIISSLFLIACQSRNEKEKNTEAIKVEYVKKKLQPTSDDIVYSGDLVFEKQIQIDNFLKNEKKYSFIDGSLTIVQSDNVTNLDGLINIKKINGDFMISVVPKLENIEGLKNIEIINGEFTISGTKVLNKIKVFSNLREIGGTIVFGNNYGLKEISSFDQLKEAKELYISGCSDLEVLDGFNNLEKVDKLSIFSTRNLKEIVNFKKLNLVRNTISIEHNQSLEKIAFESLQSVNEYVAIHENLVFNGGISFSSLNHMQKLFVWNNKSLVNYCNFSSDVLANKIVEIDCSGNKFNATKQDLLDGNCNNEQK
ncbi:hypothetical protein [Tenacibaculum sp. M341]|uniref:hypothetical protein n=1 Tax=Tenacibaculum sp. M341 TaxID=2530339 RepID=UPI00104D8313|nr:hypothetical protein [Tenacibaculum sp. M341]TCI90013.1 hypothetical protein EYW44_15215 [Tenacibaculum sp. M341]